MMGSRTTAREGGEHIEICNRGVPRSLSTSLQINLPLLEPNVP